MYSIITSSRTSAFWAHREGSTAQGWTQEPAQTTEPANSSLAIKTLPALRRQKEHCAVAEDGQLPIQTTLCISFTSALNHRVLWGEKLEDSIRKKCINMTTALSIAVIIPGPKRQSIDHLCPSSCILPLIWMQPNYSGAMEVLLWGPCPPSVSHCAPKFSLWNGCERKWPQCNSSSLLSFCFFTLNPREQVDYRNKFPWQRNSKMTVRGIINTSWDNLVKCRLGCCRSGSSLNWMQCHNVKTGQCRYTPEKISMYQHAGWAYRPWALSSETEIHYGIFQRINAITFLLRSFSSFWEENGSILDRFWNYYTTFS